MKVGDLVKVRFPTNDFYNGEEYIGIILTTSTTSNTMREIGCEEMWCFQTNSRRLINKFTDEIKVLSS